ncbi:MAG: M23 family metallopeptidase [Chloroflexi bacterium]|nr:M23 family metallopeptidase [Chloroflexota bacterium]
MCADTVIWNYPYDEDDYDEWNSLNEAEFDDPFDDWETAVEQFEDDLETEDSYAVPWWQNGFGLLAIVLLIVILGGLALTQTDFAQKSLTQEQVESGQVGGQRSSNFQVNNPTAVASPYAEYTVTQGLHGQSYGHLAIDLAAGRGEPVLSPINGLITDLYIDEYGNTTLQIENDVYVVLLLHGDFSVDVGDEIRLGQTIGSEGNNGYTMDMFGNLCYGRVACGNHTHLNVYDKRLRANINPLDLIQ